MCIRFFGCLCCLKLSAIYLPAETKSEKTALVAHGYMGDAETMTNYAKMFHDMGYNVLVPDARGHGKSEGDYIGFGWPERKDYVQWFQHLPCSHEQLELFFHFSFQQEDKSLIISDRLSK